MEFELTEAQRLLKRAAREFNNREIEPRAMDIDRAASLPGDLLPKLGTAGLLGMTVPKHHGGQAATHLDCALVIEELSASGTGAWWLAAFNNSIPHSIARYGSQQTRQQYLPSLCAGEAYASIQFTEAATGSDPEALETRADPSAQGYVINGSKRFSTFGARHGPALLFAKDAAGACTAFLVDKLAPGYSVGKVWEIMGGGGAEPADVTYKDYQAPPGSRLGEMAKGFDILIDWVTMEKVQQCAANVGMAQAALAEAVRYANGRQAGGRPISGMQGVRWMFAEMQAKLEAARWVTYRAAALLDKGTPDRITYAALAKVFVVPATIEVTELSRRIHGGYGYVRDYKIERLCRAAAGATGVATTLEINRSVLGAAVVRSLNI